MICELQRKWSRTIIKRLNLQTQILSKMQIKLGTALRQSDVMLKHTPVQKSSSKVLKTWYFPNSACQWGMAVAHPASSSLATLLGLTLVSRGGVEAQGSRPRPRTQKNPRPRPRTAFLRTDTLEAKDRNARGQGQVPRTQAQAFSKKKVL